MQIKRDLADRIKWPLRSCSRSLNEIRLAHKVLERHFYRSAPISIPFVSENAQSDGPATDPKYTRRYNYIPTKQLADIHLFSQGQPFDAYKTLRQEAPVCWHPEPYAYQADGPGFWAVTRYDDIKKVELDTKTFSSQRGGINLSFGASETRHPLLHAAALNNMISLDAPYHLPLRRQHMPYFTPEYVATLKIKIETQIDTLLDALDDAGPRADLVKYFSAELPLFTLSEMLGIPASDRPKLIEWMHHLELAADTLAKQGLTNVDPSLIMSFMAKIQEMFDYGRDILDDRRKAPRDDLLSAIANAELEGEELPEHFLDGSWLLIIFAGNDTTRNSISGTVKLLTEFPDQKAKLLQNRSLLPGMVDEAIRMISPVIHMRRTATCDTELSGQKIAEGEKVVIWYGSANRDETVFDDPDNFDIERKNAKDHLAFGLGPHVCLGQRVANMQLTAAFEKILTRFPKIEWTGEIEIAPTNFVHAISRLGVDLNGSA